MKVAVLTTSFPRHAADDAGTFVKKLVDAFSQVGLSGTVVVPQDAEEPALERCSDFTIRRFAYGLFSKGSLAFGAGILPNLRARPGRALQIPGFFIALFRASLKASREADLIQANWIFTGLAACAVSYVRKIPYVITLRGEDLKLVKHPLLKILFGPAMRRAARIVTVNKKFCAEVGSLYRLSDARISCIGNGVNVPEVSESSYATFISRENYSSAQSYLVFLGRLIPLKRVELIIQLMGKPELSHYKLLLCGRALNEKYLEDLKGLARQNNCYDRIVFKGMVAPDEVGHYLKLSRYFITASEFEGRPNSVLEAMAVGRVVLASDIEAHSELIEDEKNGILFSPGNIEELARKIKHLDSNHDRYAQLAEQGKKSVANFSWQTCAESYKNLFTQVLAENVK